MELATTPQQQDVFLRADNLRLLIPQTEVAAIGHLDARPEPSGLPGLLAVPGRDDACYLVLSGDFGLLDSCPDNRFVTTRMYTDDGMETFWCWEEARVLLDFAPEIHPIPDVLLTAKSPLREYALMDEQLVFLCHAETLQNLTLGA